MGDSPRCAHDNNHEQQPNLERPVHAGPARDPGDVCCSQSLTRVTLCKAPVRSLQGVGGTATGSLLPYNVRRDGHDRGPPRRAVAEFHSITGRQRHSAVVAYTKYGYATMLGWSSQYLGRNAQNAPRAALQTRPTSDESPRGCGQRLQRPTPVHDPVQLYVVAASVDSMTTRA